MPWFALPNPAWATHTAVFGHWAALGLDIGPHHIGLDTLRPLINETGREPAPQRHRPPWQRGVRAGTTSITIRFDGLEAFFVVRVR